MRVGVRVEKYIRFFIMCPSTLGDINISIIYHFSPTLINKFSVAQNINKNLFIKVDLMVGKILI